MARIFGGASTDKIVSALTAHATQRTWAAWIYRTGQGGGNSGRIFDKRVSGAQVENLFHSGNLYWEFDRLFSGGQAVWRINLTTINEWHHIALTYDSSSESNDPIFYVDGVAQTLVGDTNSTGTATNNADAYVIGNRASDSLRNFAGRIAEFAIWDRILTPAECAGLGKGMSPLFYPNALTEYIPMVRDNISKKLSAPTITGTTVTDHPRIIYPH